MDDPIVVITCLGIASLLTYILYLLIDSRKKIKIEELINGSKAIENKIDSMLPEKNLKKLSVYQKILKEVSPSKIVNIYMVIIVSLLLALLAYREASRILNQTVGGLIIATVVFCGPFLMLKILGAYQRRKERSQMPHFLHMFDQSITYSSGGIEALNIIQNKIKDPIKSRVREFVKNINQNMDAFEAIEILKSRTSNEVFKSFADALYMEIEYGKSMRTDMELLINKAYTHEENYEQRLTMNTGNVVAILGMLFLLVISVKKMTTMNAEYVYILTQNREGKMAVDVVMILLIIAFWMVRKSVDYQDS